MSVLSRLIAAIYKLDDGHGGHDYTVVLCRRQKTGNGETNHSRRTRRGDHVEGDGRVGGTKERRVDGHSDHGDANHVDDGVQATAMVKRIK